MTAMPVSCVSSLEALFHPVFAALPPGLAMRDLLGSHPVHLPPAWSRAHAAAEAACAAPEMRGRTDLQAGLWLYVGDFARAGHALARDSSPTGAFWRAILRRRKGDYDNALHWYAQADRHPAMEGVNLSGGPAGAGTEVASLDPPSFVARVRRHAHDPDPPADLLALQEREWAELFKWCMER